MLALLLISCKEEQDYIDLAGTWTVQLDDDNFRGQTFSINLPGTTDGAGIGNPDTVQPILERNTMLHLSRKHSYVGKALYSTTFSVSESLAQRPLELTLERVLWTSRVMIDGTDVNGIENSLVSPHHHIIPPLSAGEHSITIEVDNTKQYDISVDELCHSYTDATQVKWNGILGEIKLMPINRAHIERVEIWPDIISMTADVEIFLREKSEGGSIKVVSSLGTSTAQTVEAGAQSIRVQLSMKDAKLWSEFDPQIYDIDIDYESNDGTKAKAHETFGMRKIANENGKLCINGNPVFLRGTLECCIFPLTGNPPTDEAGWETVFNAAKEWGLNHLRFHSWCPPNAAFRVADRMGFYLSVELPVWTTNLGHDRNVCKFMEKEAERIISCYGNHPSLCMISNGNELQYDFDFLNYLTAKLKARDNRHVYTTTSFTFEKGHGGKNEPEDQYLVTQRTDSGWVRGQGVFDIEAPSFNKNYDASMVCVDVPLISHEIGQYAVYPDISEIASYTGSLAPHNLEAVRNDLSQKGLLNKAQNYLQASGHLAAILYKEEIERAMKTKGFSGYQLLGLQDFPGQGTALIGLVNAFWQSKGIVSAEWFRQFCAPIVPLANFSKAIWTNDETFELDIQVANYSLDHLCNKNLKWKLAYKSGKSICAGESLISDIPNGDVFHADSLRLPLGGIKETSELIFSLAIEGTEYKNEWDIWVYQSDLTIDSGNTIVTDDVNLALAALDAGRSVLLSPKPEMLKGLQGKFVPVFWSPIHFPKQAGTMGLLCNPNHPGLSLFPTEMHSNWQWWRLAKRSTVLITDSLPQITPIVEAVDNFANNRRLASIFEAKCGKGKLLFSAMDLLSDGADSPEIRQLRHSLTEYMKSDEFDPSGFASKENLMTFFK